MTEQDFEEIQEKGEPNQQTTPGNITTGEIVKRKTGRTLQLLHDQIDKVFDELNRARNDGTREEFNKLRTLESWMKVRFTGPVKFRYDQRISEINGKFGGAPTERPKERWEEGEYLLYYVEAHERFTALVEAMDTEGFMTVGAAFDSDTGDEAPVWSEDELVIKRK